MLKLKQIYVGDVDAKNELFMMTEDEAYRFQQSFTMPASLDTEDYLEGRSFYVTGLKGTGKTAFLRYLSLLAKERQMISRFVLFKSEVKESEKQELQKQCDTVVVEEAGSKKYLLDYEKVWMIFFHKVIMNILSDSRVELFKEDGNWKKYKSLVMGADYGNKALGILEFFPKITGSMLSFKLLDKEVASLNLDLHGPDKSKIKITSLVNAINKYFGLLSPKAGKVLIFVDELELSLGSRTQYQRDISLIRDLILVVEQINRTMAAVNFPIKICCAVRKEVISAIEGTGKEVAKPVEDFGSEIAWSFPVGGGQSAINHSLIALLSKKIHVSEVLNKVSSDYSVEGIFARYFPTKINDQYIAEYLLHKTWFRPRDLSRMLKMIISHFGKSEDGFKQIHFEHTQKNYATASWVELAEELSAKYDKGSVHFIEKMFMNVRRSFDISDLRSRVHSMVEYDDEASKYRTAPDLSGLLNDLFEIGFLGNAGSTYRFRFRGDTFLNVREKMCVHRALWPHFSIIQ